MSTLEIVLYSAMGLFIIIYGTFIIRKAVRKKKGLIKEKDKDEDE